MRLPALLEKPRQLAPGLVASLVIAAAATFLSQH